MQDKTWKFSGWIILILFTSNLNASKSSESCAYIHFQDLEGASVIATENTIVSLSFDVLNHTRCDALENYYRITVSKKNEKQFLIHHCAIEQTETSCDEAPRGSGCICLKDHGEGRYLFQKQVDRRDNTTWRWWTDNAVAKPKEIPFVIQWPPRITSLNISASEYEPGTTLLKEYSTAVIDCFWEDGNPAKRARLLNRKGDAIGDIINTNQVKYTFPAVSCQDAGLIRCEAPGASHNKTATLLVKCSPEFQSARKKYAIAAGASTQLKFAVRTPEKKIAACKLIFLSGDGTGSGNTARQSCQSFSSLTGTPPDLTLTVRLDNVRKEEEGQWRLVLTNAFGNGHVDFHIRVSENGDDENQQEADEDDDITMETGDIPGTTNQTEEDDENDNTGGAVGGSFTVIILLVAGAVAAFFIYKKRFLCRQYEEPLPRVDVRGPRRSLENLEMIGMRRSRHSAASEDQHIYSEVSEIVAPRAAPLVAPPPAPSAARQIMEPVPNDYLQPVLDTHAYEHPVQPRYAVPNTLYDALRPVYQTLRVFGSRIRSFFPSTVDESPYE